MRTTVLVVLICAALGSAQPEKPPLPPQAIARLATGGDSSGNATHIHPPAFAPDGSTLAWGERKDHTVRVWNVKKGDEVWKLHGHESHVLCAAYAPDGERLATGSYDGSIRVWDLLTGRALKVLRPAGARSMVYSVAFSPDGKSIASGEWSGTVRLWDAASGAMLRSASGGTGKGKQSFVQVVAFAPDGKTLVTGAEGATVRFWDPATLTEREKLRKVVPPVMGVPFASGYAYASSLAFSPDGKTLAVSFHGAAQAIYLWDVETGKEVQKLDGTPSAYTVAFSPDGKFLLSTARELRVWELASGRTALQIEEPRAWLYSMYSGGFSPDGRLLASGGQDNGVMLWDAFGHERDWQPPEPTLANLSRLVKELGDTDATVAYRAIGTLVKLGKPAVALLKVRVQVIPNADPKQLAQWLRDLDHENFDLRERAEAALRAVGEAAEQGLRAALRTTTSNEVRMRARRLLQEVVPFALTRARTISVLEYQGTADARQALEAFAKGDERAALTRAAQAALTRLARRPVAER